MPQEERGWQRQHRQVGGRSQILPSPLRPHFVRATLRIHEYPGGRLAVFHGPHRLADYDAEGKLRNDQKLAA